MKEYDASRFFWWASLSGSCFPRALPWAVMSTALTCVVHHYLHDAIYTKRTDHDFLQHPSLYQAFLVMVGFVMVFRTQIAYQRFWEARTMFAQMQSKWQDAVQQAFIFDDIHKSGGELQPRSMEAGKSYRHRMIHLFSVLHAMACIRLLRLDESFNGSPKAWLGSIGEWRELPPEEKAAWQADPANKYRENFIQNSKASYRFRCGEGFEFEPFPYLGSWDPAERNVLLEDPSVWLWGEEGVHYDATTGMSSEASIEANTYCGRLCINPEHTLPAEDVSVDRVGIVMGWIMREVGLRQIQGGVAVPPPVLSRLYQVLSDGRLGFQHCEKICDCPFPFPYAQLAWFLLATLSFTFPFLLTMYCYNMEFAAALAFILILCYHTLEEVARELQDPFNCAINDIYLQNLHKSYLMHLIVLDRQMRHPPRSLEQRLASACSVEEKWPDCPVLKPLENPEDISRARNLSQSSMGNPVSLGVAAGAVSPAAPARSSMTEPQEEQGHADTKRNGDFGPGGSQTAGNTMPHGDPQGGSTASALDDAKKSSTGIFHSSFVRADNEGAGLRRRGLGQPQGQTPAGAGMHGGEVPVVPPEDDLALPPDENGAVAGNALRAGVLDKALT